MHAVRYLLSPLLASLLVAGSCGGGATPAPAAESRGAASVAPASATPLKVTKVKIGVVSVTGPTFILALEAQALGIAGKRGLEFEFVDVQATVQVQALASGQIDILGGTTIEGAILTGLDARMIAAASKPYWRLWGRKGVVESWGAIKGKNVGVSGSRGAAGDVLFNSLLTSHGIDPSQVTFFYNSAVANYQALAAGSVDVAFTAAPYTYALAEGGKHVQIDDLGPANAKSISAGYTMMRSKITADADFVERFVAAMLDAEKVVLADPLDPRVIPAYEKYLTDKGVDPKTLGLSAFLKELREGKTWQIIPTRDLVAEGLRVLGQVAEFKDLAPKATFEDLVYIVPSLRARY